jgi:hypothetical protein
MGFPEDADMKPSKGSYIIADYLKRALGRRVEH